MYYQYLWLSCVLKCIPELVKNESRCREKRSGIASPKGLVVQLASTLSEYLVTSDRNLTLGRFMFNTKDN